MYHDCTVTGLAGQPEPLSAGCYRPGMVMEQWNPETRSHDR